MSICKIIQKVALLRESGEASAVLAHQDDQAFYLNSITPSRKDKSDEDDEEENESKRGRKSLRSLRK